MADSILLRAKKVGSQVVEPGSPKPPIEGKTVHRWERQSVVYVGFCCLVENKKIARDAFGCKFSSKPEKAENLDNLNVIRGELFMFSLCLRVKNQPLGREAFFFVAFETNGARVCVCCGAGEGMCVCVCVCVCVRVCVCVSSLLSKMAPVCVRMYLRPSASRLRVKNQPLSKAALLFVALGIDGARVSLR